MKCTTCSHKDRTLIEKSIARGGVSFAELTKRHGLQKDALRRHRTHMPTDMLRAPEREVAAATDITNRVTEALIRVFDAAVREGKDRLVIETSAAFPASGRRRK